MSESLKPPCLQEEIENPRLRFSNPGSAQTEGTREAGIGPQAMVVVMVQVLLPR